MTLRRSLVLSFAQKYTSLALKLVSVAVLSRLVTPHDFGIFAAAAALWGVFAAVADVGTSQFVVQDTSENPAIRRTALGVTLMTNVVAAIALGLFVWIVPLSWTGAEIGLPTLVLALTMPISAPGTIGAALLQREFRFGELYVLGAVGTALSIPAAAIAAMQGLGGTSLCVAMLVEGLVAAVALPLAVRNRGEMIPSFSHWRSLRVFGAAWSGINVVKQVADSAVRFMVGAWLGIQPLGLLARSLTVINLFDRLIVDAVSPVLLPALTQARRGEGELGRIYLLKVAFLSATAWPFFGFVALAADPLVRVLLGPQWLAAILPVQLLCVAGLFIPFGSLIVPFFIALDALPRFIPLQVTLQGVRLVLVVGACAWGSLEAVCIALALENLVKALLVAPVLGSRLAVPFADMAGPLAKSVAVTLACLLVARLVLAGTPAAWPALLVVALAAVAGALAWLGVLALTGHPMMLEVRRLAAWRPGRGAPAGLP